MRKRKRRVPRYDVLMEPSVSGGAQERLSRALDLILRAAARAKMATTKRSGDGRDRKRDRKSDRGDRHR